MARKRRISIKDIANTIGVSHSTVSRALHGKGRMSDETRSRIVESAQEHGYTPSLMARGLVTQRSYCVGLVVPQFSDPFHSEVAQGVEDEARRHGYSLFLSSMGVDPQREIDVVLTFHARQVDGIIATSSRVGNGYSELLNETEMPLVLLNSHVEADQINAINHDDYGGGCLLVQYLIDRGYKRIAFIGNERGIRTTTERRRAWFDTLTAARLPAELETLGSSGRLQGGVQATETLLEKAQHLWGSPPDAIYCYNDTMALGAHSVLRAKGLRVPEDVALTGFDDIEIAAFMEPALTTLRQPRYEMGVAALRMLLTLIDTPFQQPKSTSVVGELVERRSA